MFQNGDGQIVRSFAVAERRMRLHVDNCRHQMIFVDVDDLGHRISSRSLASWPRRFLQGFQNADPLSHRAATGVILIGTRRASWRERSTSYFPTNITPSKSLEQAPPFM